MFTERELAEARAIVLRTIDDRYAREWRDKAGRDEIETAHVPLGWFGVDTPMTAAIDALIDEGAVEIVELPHSVDPTRTVKFVAKLG